MDAVTFGVLTISDTCYQDPEKDRSGPRLLQLIGETFRNAQVISSVLPDDQDLIQRELRKWIDRAEVRAIFTTGGTGFAPRDVTPEATKPLLDKDCPQLATLITLASLQNTKFAALSRGVCGIAGSTLILNFPGSEKAVVECFQTVSEILPHALQLISNDVALVRRTHAQMQSTIVLSSVHVCPHNTGAGNDTDRNSPFAMVQVQQALDTIFMTVKRNARREEMVRSLVSPVDIPPFQASIKDGYAMKSTGFPGVKRVLGCISAGDTPNQHELQEDECFKINTGAPLPEHADCVVQIEDTKLLQRDKYGNESLVEIRVQPTENQDVRSIGSDVRKGDLVFTALDASLVVEKSILASVGLPSQITKPTVAILSTGSELLAPHEPPTDTKVYDSNTTMLQELLKYFGFECLELRLLSDDYEGIMRSLSNLFDTVDFVICSGGVSMGDKDYIKPALKQLNFTIHFGRLNMKPGKPTTYATRGEKYFFGLPGNPASAFVAFHLFALPAVRWADGWDRAKCTLPIVKVKLLNTIGLDPRPEFVRASITCINGELFASVNGEQISSCLQSIVGADVLLHLPGRTPLKTQALMGEECAASVLRYDFISKYSIGHDPFYQAAFAF